MKKVIEQIVITIAFIILIGMIVKLGSQRNEYKERIKEINYNSIILDSNFWVGLEDKYGYPYYKVVIYGSLNGINSYRIDSFAGKDLPIIIHDKQIELITKKQFYNDRLNR